MLLVGVLVGMLCARPAASWIFGSSGAFEKVVACLLVMSVLHLAAVTTYRWVRSRELRSRVAVLPSAQRALVLAPFLHERRGDARKLVVPMMQEFGLSAEITPTTVPDARGDEPAPVEQPDAARLEE
jgi:hypothetical protein